MSGARIAIDGTDAIRMRAAAALASDHRIDRVGILERGAPKAWGKRMLAIDDPAGWDVVVGRTAAGVPDVTTGPGGAVSWAGPTGLVRALATRLGPDARLAGTIAGDPLSAPDRIAFPAPIGWVSGTPVDGILHCPVRGSLAAVVAADDSTSLAVMDDRGFLDGATLAAGVLLAATAHRGPVWEAAEDYLALVTDLGLVIAGG